jgi:hypothetical protein
MNIVEEKQAKWTEPGKSGLERFYKM